MTTPYFESKNLNTVGIEKGLTAIPLEYESELDSALGDREWEMVADAYMKEMEKAGEVRAIAQEDIDEMVENYHSWDGVEGRVERHPVVQEMYERDLLEAVPGRETVYFFPSLELVSKML